MKHDWKISLRIVLTCFLLYLCLYYWENAAALAVTLFRSALPLLLGCILAYLLNILMMFYEHHYFTKTTCAAVIKSRRPVCMLAAIATLAGIVVLIFRLVVPELLQCIRLLVAEVPPAIQKAVDWVQESGLLTSEAAKELFISLEQINWREKIMQVGKLFLDGLGGAAQIALTTVSSLVSILMTSVISLIFAVYLLLGKERLSSQFGRVMLRYLPSNLYKKLIYVFTTVDFCFYRFIVGQCLEAVILGLLCMLGMTILHLPYAVMIGTLIGFTALIPVAGAYIGGGIGAFMILTVSPVKALIFLLFLLVLQQLEGNLIYPRVVGTSIGLPAVWVLAAVTLGGGVLGIGGMLVAVPLTAALYQMLRLDVNRHLNPPVPEEAEE